MKVQTYGGFCVGLFSLFILQASATTNSKILDVEEPEQSIKCETCVKIDTACYNTSYLFKLNAPFRENVVIKKMCILNSNNVLYYSFEPRLDDPEYFKVAYVSLDKPNSSGVINGAQTFDFNTFDINQNENRLYLGGSDGVWVIRNANTAGPYASLFASKDDITNLISKENDNVYFTKKGVKGIIKRSINGNLEVMVENRAVKLFVLSNDVIVYLHSTGLYAFNIKRKEHVRLSTNSFFRGLTLDANGVVYAWYLDWIYKVILNDVLIHS